LLKKETLEEPLWK